MRPGVNRIRATFDYEKLGASAAPRRQGHGSDHPRQRQAAHDEFAVEAGATAARARIPEFIADSFRGQPRHPAK